MPLKPIVSKLDEVDESLRSFYKEHGDQFILDVVTTDGWALEDVAGLKSALSRKSEELTSKKALLAEYGDMTPEQALAHKRAAEAKVKDKDGKDVDVDAMVEERVASIRDSLQKKNADDAKKAGEREAQLLGVIEETLIDAQATIALNAQEGNVELMLPHCKKGARVKEVDGKFRVEILDSDGNPRLSMKQGSQDLLGWDERVAELKASETFGMCFKGSGTTGTGATGNRGTTSGKDPFADLADDKMDPYDRLAAARERGAIPVERVSSTESQQVPG